MAAPPAKANSAPSTFSRSEGRRSVLRRETAMGQVCGTQRPPTSKVDGPLQASMRILDRVSGSSTKVLPGAILNGVPSARMNSNGSATLPLRQVPVT